MCSPFFVHKIHSCSHINLIILQFVQNYDSDCDFHQLNKSMWYLQYFLQNYDSDCDFHQLNKSMWYLQYFLQNYDSDCDFHQLNNSMWYLQYFLQNYDSDCDLRSQLRCQVGDLVGKHGEFSTVAGRALYTDVNLPLVGRGSGK